jgi:hypothetical protein
LLWNGRGTDGVLPIVFFKLHRQFADYSFEALVLTFEPALLLCFLRHLKNFTGILQKLVAP